MASRQHEGHAFRQLCRQGSVELMDQMLRTGINIDAAQDDGCTGLWLASEAGVVDAVKLLCSRGATINAVKTSGHVSALYIAAQNGHAGVVDVLLLHGANPNLAKASGSTPLLIAAQQNFADVVRSLIRAGANINATNQQGITPIAVAAFRGNAQVVKLLLAAGADPLAQAQGKSAVEWAASGGHRQAIQQVIDQHLRMLEAEIHRRQVETHAATSSIVRPAAAATETPRPAAGTPRPGDGGASFDGGPSGGGAAGGWSSRSKSLADSEVFQWYNPSFLTRSPSLAEAAVLHQRVDIAGARSPGRSFWKAADGSSGVYNTRSFSEPLSPTVGVMQPTGTGLGITQEVLLQESRRSTHFRSMMRKDARTLKANGAPAWESAVRSASPDRAATSQALYATEQQWEAHRQRIDAVAELQAAKRATLDDAWMYSAEATASYGEQVLAVKRQISAADKYNREQKQQSRDTVAASGFALPRTDPEALKKLEVFMTKGLGAKGPPPPLPPEEPLPMEALFAQKPPASSSYDSMSSIGVRPVAAAAESPLAEPAGERKLTALEKLQLRKARGQ